LKAHNIPTNALINGVSFPPIPPELQGLTQLEERLLAVRQPFMKIVELSPYAGAQYGLRGSCVNVPTELNSTVNVLPRHLNESETVLVKLKRRMQDKNPYAYDLIRPEKVYRAAQYLVNTELYKKHNITLDEHWLHNANKELEVVDINEHNDECKNESNIDREIIATNKEEEVIEKKSHDILAEFIENITINDQNSDSENEDAEIEKEMQKQESMVMPDILPDHIAKDTGITIAPGEGKTPISLLRDDDADVLSFPTIYCGKPREFKVPLKDAELKKCEIRNHDRRAAKNVPKLFMTFCKSRLRRLVNRISIALRKKKMLKIRRLEAY
jgi:hypothetical protein